MPASPYQVMAGTVIAGALTTGIKSDLSGDVIATVYDMATGKFMLIPQGARLLGKSAMGSAGFKWYGTASSAGHILADAPIRPASSDWRTVWTTTHRIVSGAVLKTLLGGGTELAAPESRQHGNRIVIAERDNAYRKRTR